MNLIESESDEIIDQSREFINQSWEFIISIQNKLILWLIGWYLYFWIIRGDNLGNNDNFLMFFLVNYIAQGYYYKLLHLEYEIEC